jgi:glycerol kinase
VVQGWRERRRFEPEMEDDERRVLLDGWRRAVRVTRVQAGGTQER